MIQQIQQLQLKKKLQESLQIWDASFHWRITTFAFALETLNPRP
jgi:hypothetical protein